MEYIRSLDRVINRLIWAPVSEGLECDEERERRIRAHIRRIRSDPRWQPEREHRRVG